MSDEDLTRRVVYADGATFIPKCHCGRIVKADKTIKLNGLDELSKEPNGTCTKHGRINMIFEGWV